METSTRQAIQFFDSLGFSTEEIPVTNGERADFRAHDGEREYIVEVKDRIDDPKTIAKQLSPVEVDGEQFYFRVSPIDRSNRLDGILKKGGNQLEATPSQQCAYRLIWLRCDGIDDDLQETRARNTFYGIVPVVPVGRGSGCMCLYFDFNSAHFLRHVNNGLIIVTKRGLRLYLNEFAANAEAFHDSQLVRALGDAVFDPQNVVADGHLAFKGEISRKNENDVLDGLEKQTGVRYRVTRLQRYSL